MPLTLTPKYFVDSQGNFLGRFVGIQHDPKDPKTIEQPMPTDQRAIEVPVPPNHGKDTWDGTKWVAYVPPADTPDNLVAGIRDPVMMALIELVPGGEAAIKTKIAEIKAR